MNIFQLGRFRIFSKNLQKFEISQSYILLISQSENIFKGIFLLRGSKRMRKSCQHILLCFFGTPQCTLYRTRQYFKKACIVRVMVKDFSIYKFASGSERDPSREIIPDPRNSGSDLSYELRLFCHILPMVPGTVPMQVQRWLRIRFRMDPHSVNPDQQPQVQRRNGNLALA